MTGFLTTTVTGTAQVPLVHRGDGVALVANNDLTNTIWISDDYGVQPQAGNAAPLPPQASVVVDGTTDIFAVALPNQTAQVVVIPGGQNFFQLVSLLIKTLIITATANNGIFVYSGQPHGPVGGGLTEANATPYVGLNASSPASVTTAAFTPTANTLLVCLAGAGNGGNAAITSTAVTDSVGGTWTKLISQGVGNNTSVEDVWVKDAGSAPVSQTVTFAVNAGVSGLNIIIQQFTNAKPAVSQTGVTISTSGTDSSNITPSTTGSQVVGSLGQSSSAFTLTANASTTFYGQTAGTFGDSEVAFEANTLSTAQSPINVGVTNHIVHIVAAEILPSGTGNLVGSFVASNTTDKFGNPVAIGFNVGSQASAHVQIDLSGNINIFNGNNQLTAVINPNGFTGSGVGWHPGAVGVTAETPQSLAPTPAGWSGSIVFFKLVETNLIYVSLSVSVANGTVITNNEQIQTLPSGYFFPSDNKNFFVNRSDTNTATMFNIDGSGNLTYHGPTFTVTGGPIFFYGQGVISTGTE